jgi:hypothetical protein
MKILSILDTLANDNGRNFKIDYLTKHKDNLLLTQVVFLALDTYTQFFIRKIPAYTRGPDTANLKWALDKLCDLSSRTVTGNAAIAHLVKILESLEPDDAQVVERIIEKDLKCGVAASTVNKVWPNLVHEYPCMLASPYEEKLVNKIQFPAYAQLKMDGMRFNAIVKNGKCEFRSRNGKLIDIPSDLFQQPFLNMHEYWGTDMVFDGELLVVDVAGKPLDRKTGNGILNKAVKGTMSEEEAVNVRATLWDALPVENFAVGVYKEQYIDRIAKLSNALSHMRNQTPFGHLVALVNHTEVRTPEDASRLFLQYLKKGEEGIILKDRFGIWEDKRAKHQIKYKGVFECDLVCVGWDEGTGQNVGRLGALQLASSCGKLTVGVGTGLTEEDRINIGRDVIGKVVAVEFNAIIDDKKKDTKSLFLPVFICVRPDKDEADSLTTIESSVVKLL